MTSRLSRSALLATTLLWFAQPALSDNHETTPADTGQLAVPANDAAATLPMEGGYAISIHRASRGANTLGTYFHQPAFAVIAAPDPEPGWPPHVREIDETEDGISFMMHVRGSSEEIRRLARDVVLSPAPIGDETELQGVAPTAVEVLRWPVNEDRVAIQGGPGRDEPVLAVGVLELSGEEKRSGIWKIEMTAQAKDVERLRETLVNGRARLHYAYRYRGDNISFSRASEEFVIEAVRAVEAGLDAVNAKENGPIFQKERRDITTLVDEETERVVVANNASMMELTQFDWDETLFREATSINEFGRPLPPEMLERVQSYLQRMVDELGTEIVEEESSTQENRTTTRMTLETEGGWGADSGWEASAGGKVDKEWERKAKNEWGVTTTIDEQRNVAVATDIEVSYLSADYLRGVRRATTYAFLATPAAQGLREAEIAEASRLIPEGKQVAVAGRSAPNIPVGGSLCYFGTTERPPEGFAFLDAGSEWPDSPVFDRIGGTPMPDMDNMLMGATTRPEAVGSSWTEGSVIIDPVSVSGSNFRVEGQPMVGFMREQSAFAYGAGTRGQDWFWNGQLSLSLNQSNYRGAAFNYTNGARPNRFFRPDDIRFLALTYLTGNPSIRDGLRLRENAFLRARYYTSPESIVGEATIPQRILDLSTGRAMPNHVKCRWIIRIE